MSPTAPFHDHNAKTNNNNNDNGLCSTSLKINKDSHMIKKSSSTSLLGVAGPTKLPPQPQRHPVIIYTHSPKIIHTNPQDFMMLVQKLTGLSRSEDDHHTIQLKQEKGNSSPEEENKNMKMIGNDDNESSSVITDENCGSIGDGQVNSCFVPPIFEPPNPYITNIPLFTPNTEFLCANQPFYNYTDSLFFTTPNMRTSISSSSSSTLDGINEFHEY